jgi:hypothetical protein
MREKLAEFAASDAATTSAAIQAASIDTRYNQQAPEGGLVIRVRAKVLDGYEPTTNKWQRIFQTALSRDNMWTTKQEADALASGQLPKQLLLRMARFHLVDNTRGEPLMWKPDELRTWDIALSSTGEITGAVRIRSKDESRGYDAALRGRLETVDGKVTRLDMVFLGDCWGDGPYTRGAPKGRFPLAIAFTLADGTDIADPLPPQGARGWLDGYLK